MNKLETITLDNGLKIYLYNDLRRHSTFFQFTTFCGGITKHFVLDGKEYNLSDGCSHILEHYLVECNDEGHFLDVLGKRQMSTNASTSLYTTSYYFETVEDVSFGIRTLLNGVYNVSFDNDKLEKLKGPIHQEIRSRFDNKFYHLGRLRIKCLFNNIDYVDIGGTLDEVSNTTISDIEALYKAFYQPNNQFIVVAGNFNRDEVVEEINNFYNNHLFEKHEVKVIPYNEKLEVSCEDEELSFPTPMDYLDISFKIDVGNFSGEELLDLEFYTYSFFDSFFGVTSSLHKELIDDEIIIDGIGCSSTRIDNYLIISIGAYTSNKDVFKERVFDAIEKMNQFDEDLFNVSKKSSIVKLVLRDENIFKMVSPLINNIVYYNYPYLDEVKDIEKLTFNEFVSTIKSLDFSNYSIIHIKNKD